MRPVSSWSVILVRAGQCVRDEQGRVVGRADSPLTPLGHAQAQSAADQLRHDDLPSRVRAQLRDADMPPEALCLELTESTLLTDPVAAIARFEELRADGVGLAIDDFGTGYSSILQLKRLPVTALKIDRSFVEGMTHNAGDAAIISAVVMASTVRRGWDTRIVVLVVLPRIPTRVGMNRPGSRSSRSGSCVPRAGRGEPSRLS